MRTKVVILILLVIMLIGLSVEVYATDHFRTMEQEVVVKILNK